MSNTPKAPSPWPPRVWFMRKEFDEAVAFNVRSPAAGRSRMGIGFTLHEEYPGEGVAFVSLEEHTHLMAEAVREAKAQVYSEVALMADNLSHDDYINGRLIDRLNRKASELRKGATPENGGKKE